MTIEVFQGDIGAVSCDVLVIGVFQNGKRLSGPVAAIDRAMEGAVADLLERRDWKGKSGQQYIFPTFGKLKARTVALIGLGDPKEANADTFRKFGGRVVAVARDSRASTVAVLLPGFEVKDVDMRTSAEAFAEGVFLADHRFHLYKGKQHQKDAQSIKTLRIVEAESRRVRQIEEAAVIGRLLAEAVITARDLVNAPSSDITPLRLAEEAQKLAVRGSGISCKLLDQKAMERMGMRAALAVARGSMHPPVGVHLTYRPKQSKKTVAIVGKAVTFDSGGLSLKPAKSMETMKIDMAGAASVIGLFQALADFKPNVTVHGIFLAVENMPSGSAYRPGDVVVAMDGTTIEVLNTDAEGRVTLADALTYAMKQKPDMIVDLATLTGACVVALGDDVAGLLTNDARLGQKILAAANEAGEPLWELPLYAPYADQIKSKIADIKNTGGGSAGTITAALFLKTFVGDTPWAHLDIAGPSYIERETRPDQPYGGTGYGVRLLLRFLEKIGK